jgi:hypothetical protein
MIFFIVFLKKIFQNIQVFKSFNNKYENINFCFKDIEDERKTK